MDKVIKDKFEQIKKVISKAKKMTFENLVTWSELENWEIGEERNISNSLNKKLVQEKNIMIFRTVIPTKFNHHWHDFVEQNFLVEGKLKDKKRTYDEGDWMRYKILEPHEVENLHDTPSVLIVIFTR